MQRRARIVSLALAACALIACERCGGADVAELRERSGVVDRSAAGASTWDDAPVGQAFSLGDAVRTGAGATASLRVGAHGGVRMQPGTILRFLSERPGQPTGVSLESGEVELESGDALALETTLGAVTLQPGARIRVRSDGETAPRIEVIAGRVEFDEEGTTRVAEAGDAFVLAVGRVVFEEEGGVPDIAAPPEDPDSAGDPATDTTETETATDTTATETTATDTTATETETTETETNGEPEVGTDAELRTARFEEAPARALLAIGAGESPVVHDPGQPPTAVRIDFGSGCAGAGTVSLTNARRTTRWRGEGSAIVLVVPGRTRYAIDCEAAGRDPSGGSITLRRDDGSHRLDAIAPRNVVDADGRTYDVLYQNALPILTVRWRDGGAGAAQLHIASGGRERTLPATGGRTELASGQLGEGAHRVWFVAGARRSPETTVRIRFDNAAPAASLREPSGASPIAPGRVRVSGMVLQGFAVRVGAVELPIDAQLRFSGDVSVPTDVDALAVRFSHPRRGVHYYLRRVAR